MPPVSVFTKSARDQRWQVVGFGAALAIMSASAVFLWPSVRDTLQNFTLPTAVQAFLGTDLSIASAAGYLSARYFGWVDILLIVYAVIQGTGAIAGEESGGTMDLLLAQPIARRDIVLQKVAAVVIGSAIIIAIGWLGFAVSIAFVRIDVSLADTAIASVNMLPITLLFFAIALWSGAVAPSRGVAAGITIGLATAAYFISTLANGVDSLRRLRYATPFYYYGSGASLVHGIQWWHVALLVGIATTLVALTVRTFEHRDVSTGGSSDVDIAAMLRRVVARGA